MELNKWTTLFKDEKDLIFNMFDYYVSFLKKKESLIKEMNKTSDGFIYSLNSMFNYEKFTLVFTLIREEK
jgi:hypothetical protein